MKKRYFLSNIRFSAFFFLLFILFGCMEEDNFHLNEGNKSISASIIEENLGTRTLLSDNPTNRKMEVYWKSGDAIGVFGSTTGSNIRYQTDESAISKDGKTTVFKTTATAAEGSLTAYYPYQQGATATPDGQLQLTMPATQTYHTEHAGIVQPDPAVNIMAGKGKNGSIAFRNLFSILRVNIAGSDGQVVEKVLFTDLSGKPVSGNFTVNWNGELPQAEFLATGSGEDLQIELDCKDGVALANNSLTKFFLIVPARNYDKGFQIEFILANGEKITKTIGASAGKILIRNMLYPIGDMFPNQEDKVSYTLHEKASIITDERLDYIQSASLNPENHHLTIKVDEGFAPVIGEMILINQTSTSLPKGYVGKVKSISGTTVVLEPVTEITEIFEELSIGGPVWSGDGTAISKGGYAIDLSQFITSIETPDGKPVEFAVDGSSLSMQVPFTRAETGFDTKFALPTLSHTFEIKDEKNPENDCELKLGVQMDLGMYFHILIQRWSLRELQCRINPTINFSSTVGIDWASATYGTEIPFIVIRTVPIPAGPVMIIPLIEFFLTFDLEGKIGFQAELSYSKEFSVGMFYNYDYGRVDPYFNIVGNETDESPWTFKPAVQLEGIFAVGVAPKVGFSLWEIIRLDTRVYTKVKSGANLNFDLKESVSNPSIYNAFSNSKLFSQLEMYMKGGIYGWRDSEIATTESTTLEHPLWEGYLVPKMENFSIISSNNELNIVLDISNNLIFDAEIGVSFYGKDDETGSYSLEAGSMNLCDYSVISEGEDKYNLNIKEGTSLPPGDYEARLTVSLDAPAGPYTLETDVTTKFIVFEGRAITLTTAKSIGETIGFTVTGNGWVDVNNNGIMDEGEKIEYSFINFPIQSQTISIYGNIITFECTIFEQLTSLEVTNCRYLEYLNCSRNKLTKLDIRDCPKLESLICSYNQLTSLDVKHLTALKSINCVDNQITSLVVSGLKMLENLDCDRNQITSLDASNCKALKTLTCRDNQIASLDVSGCKTLDRLECHGNQLTSLNVNGCTALYYLYCAGESSHKKMFLTTLDVSSCTALETLYCSYNQLTLLELKGCVALRKLDCDNNQLTSLDVTTCTALERLYGVNNQLTSLNASGCLTLNELNCRDNRLTSLDVTDCTGLKYLNCERNGLLGIVPDEFENIKNLHYDVRYQYIWNAKEDKYVVKKDTEKGYWYAHEPEGGCHSPKPCN